MSVLISGMYPRVRLRRNRRHDWLRDLVAENNFSAKDLIWSVFVREASIPAKIQKMPGIYRYTIPELLRAVQENFSKGLRAIALFPVLEHEKRSADGAEALNPQSLVYQAIRALKEQIPEVGVITDAALDAYTDHGHDGLYNGTDVPNDESLDIIQQYALLQAQAGADIIAPSDMMDGRVGAIRQLLDQHSFTDVGIMAYAAKYNSSFYGPFREALGSEKCLGKGHKRTYHMNPANRDEALREVALDLAEGADSVMIKPGLPYLDIIRQVKDRFQVPTFAFHVSGEYAMLKATALAGMLEYEKALLETMICFKRAGTDGIITYCVPDLLNILEKDRI